MKQWMGWFRDTLENRNCSVIGNMMHQSTRRRQLVARCFFSVATGMAELKSYENRNSESNNQSSDYGKV